MSEPVARDQQFELSFSQILLLSQQICLSRSQSHDLFGREDQLSESFSNCLLIAVSPELAVEAEGEDEIQTAD